MFASSATPRLLESGILPGEFGGVFTSLWAMVIARRVLPQPPAPAMVNRRQAGAVISAPISRQTAQRHGQVVGMASRIGGGVSQGGR